MHRNISMCITRQDIPIPTVNISGPRAALQRRRRKCGPSRVQFFSALRRTTSATLWPLAKPPLHAGLYFFSFFLFPIVNIAQRYVYPTVNETGFLFLNIFSIQTPIWLSMNSWDNNISLDIFHSRLYICAFVNHHSNFINRSIRCKHTAERSREYNLEVRKCNSPI